MKRLLPVAPILLLFALLLSPAAALSGARQGLSLWWTSVFPSLLPSFICLKLSQKLGLLQLASRHTKGQLVTAAAFSLAAGAPNGAKLVYALVQDGVISSKDGRRLLPLVNNVSTAFLLSIIASDLLKNKALFLPMALPFYGCAILLSFPLIMRRSGPERSCDPIPPAMPFADALSAAIGESMLDMLRVGGCILFACTLLSVIRRFGPGETASAVLASCAEVSAGVSGIALLSVPMRMKVSLMLGAAAFGGLSLALQTICCFPDLKLIPYLIRKLSFGVLVGTVCYLLFPLFPGALAVFASRREVLSRSLAMSALLVSSVLSVAFIGVLSLMISPKYRKDPKESCK